MHSRNSLLLRGVSLSPRWELSRTRQAVSNLGKLKVLWKLWWKVFREVAAGGVVDLVLITARPGNGWEHFPLKAKRATYYFICGKRQLFLTLLGYLWGRGGGGGVLLSGIFAMGLVCVWFSPKIRDPIGDGFVIFNAQCTLSALPLINKLKNDFVKGWIFHIIVKQVLVSLWQAGGHTGSYSWSQILLQPPDGKVVKYGDSFITIYI